ncbi:hypothetical protein U0035_07830 [Niabella yanshanensis]|uniref:DUF3806 domain-containing protein n=1 Tax=Niabella yanshanensis TaxID=577386 RepID=A0ABZ0WCZ9_9BACT|nr:hypothetical protein [Niabella yanshanensis]WQD40052.1 hypothetical protein U0035_07830 [Niabella yanshanensis]
MNIEEMTSLELAEVTRLKDLFFKKNNLSDNNDALSCIKDKVDVLKNSSLSDDAVIDNCFQIGSAYGILIQDYFGWNWSKIKTANQFAYAICSPDLSYGIQVYYYFNLLLTTDKVNNVVLLFNMISELQKTGDKSITFLV